MGRETGRGGRDGGKMQDTVLETPSSKRHPSAQTHFKYPFPIKENLWVFFFFFKEMADSTAGAGNVQDEPGPSCEARKEVLKK